MRTVVLMVQHNEQGALGLVLNRPLELTVRDACKESLPEQCEVEQVLHQGGPCQGPLMVIHANELSKDSDVFPGVYFTTERGKIEILLKQSDAQGAVFRGIFRLGAGAARGGDGSGIVAGRAGGIGHDLRRQTQSLVETDDAADDGSSDRSIQHPG